MARRARSSAVLVEQSWLARHDRLAAALLVAGVALALRVLHVWQIRRAPFFDLTLGDAAAYDAWARRIAAGDWVGRDVFYQAPLYPYGLALVYTVVGSSPFDVRLVQALVSAMSCALVADAGRRLFGRRAGLIAGLMLAAYAPAIFLDTLIQKSVLDLCCLAIVLWLVSRILSAPAGRAVWWPLGAALGCLTLTRENAGVLVLPVAIWLALQRPLARRERAVRSVLLVAGLASILVPVAARNWAVGHEIVITTSQFGPNLYIGNNERADGAYRPLRPFRETPAFERQDATELAELAVGRRLAPGEVSSYYTRQVLAFVRTHPGAWVRLLGRKVVLAWNAIELPDTEDEYTYARWSWPASLGRVWHFGVLAPLAGLGMFLTAREWRRLWLVYLMLAAYVATLVIFYVFARYRFPMVPFLVLFAAAGVSGVREFVRGRSTVQIVSCALVVAGVAAFCNLPVVAVSRLEAATHYNVAVGLERRGDRERAIDEYREAVRLDPALGVAHNDLGLLLAAEGRLAEAAGELQRAVEGVPGNAAIHNNLGVVLGRLGRPAEALRQFEEAVRINPRYFDAHRNLASVAVAAGRLEDAASALRAAIQLAPDRADVHNNLGIVLARQGQPDAAAVEFNRALAINPADAQARRNIERLSR